MPPTINEVINQKKFRSLQQKAQIDIIYTANWITTLHSPVFKSYGITVQQYNVLRILKGAQNEPLNMGTIRSRMLDKMSDTSRIIDRMVRMQLVQRISNETDRRSTFISITSKGLQLLDEMQKEEIRLDQTGKNLNDNELELLCTLLDRFRD